MKYRLILLAVAGTVLTAALAWAIVTFTLPLATRSMAEGYAPVAVELDDQEWQRLSELPKLRMGYIPNSYPLSFYSKRINGLGGVAGDYASLLSKALGLRFELVPVQTIPELYQLIKDGRVDFVPMLSTWYGGDTGLVFSQPYQHLPEVFVTRQDRAPILEVAELNGQHIVTAATAPTPAMLARMAPAALITMVSGPLEGLQMVADGEADAYVGNLAVVDVLIREQFSYRLKLAGPTGVVAPLGFAVTKEYAWLVPLLNRFLDAMPDRQQRQILNSWMAVQYNTGLDWARVVRTLLPAALGVLLVLSVLLFAYLKFRREALQRREAEARLIDVTRFLPAVVFQASMDAKGQLLFTYMSGNSNSIWGLSAEEMRAEPWKFLEKLVALDLNAFSTEMDRAERTNTPFLLEFRVRQEQGVRWIRGNAVPHAGPAGSVLWSGYWVDITDNREQAELLQEARDVAERATRSKTEFLAMMSHEIRTPLNGVIGMLEILGSTKLDSRQRSLLRVVDDSAENLLRLVNEVLDLSKIEAGMLELHEETLDIRTVVDQVLALFKPMAQSRGLSLHERVAPDVKLGLRGDAARLRQILMNLVSNAVKFTESGRVTVRIVVLKTTATHQRLRIEVIDTGPGVDEQTQARLFTPYVQGQAGGDTPTAVAGTGLGLSICRKLAEAMDGKIELSSELGVGTCVDVEVSLGLPPMPVVLPLIVCQEAFVNLPDAQTAQTIREFLQAVGIEPVVGAVKRPRRAENVGRLLVSKGRSPDEIKITLSLGSVGRRPDVSHISASPLSWVEFISLLSGEHLSDDDFPQQESFAAHYTEVDGQAQVVLPGKRVLVAEDNGASRRLMREQLAMLGYECDAVSDGLQALAMLRQRDYDLLITDCQMPEIDGIRLCEALRAMDAPANWQQLPVVMLSATTLDLSESHLASLVIRRVLLKPVKLGLLEEVLHQIFQKPETPNSAAPVDERQQALLEVFGSPEMVRQAIVWFSEAVEEDLTKLEPIIAQADVNAARAWVHRQAGTLATLGVADLLTQALSLERRLEHTSDVSLLQEVAVFAQALKLGVANLLKNTEHPS